MKIKDFHVLVAEKINIEESELIEILSKHFGVNGYELRAQAEDKKPGIMPKLERVILLHK